MSALCSPFGCLFGCCLWKCLHMFKVCGMFKMGHHLLAHLKALGRGLLMSVHGFPRKKELLSSTIRKESQVLNRSSRSAYRAGVRALGKNTDVPGFLANGGAAHRQTPPCHSCSHQGLPWLPERKARLKTSMKKDSQLPHKCQ